MPAGVNDWSASIHQFTLNAAYSNTVQAKFGTASLDLTAGANSAVYTTSTTPQVTDFNFGAGQFTIECWAWWNSHVATNFEILMGQFGGASNLGWDFGMDSTGKLAFYYSTTGTDNPSVGAAYTPATGQWIHVAADRDASNVLRVYANGVVIGSATVSSTLYASTQNLCVGNDANLSRHLPGYIDEVRISNGVARYGGAFTPPSSPFTADANTVLLLHFERGALGNIANSIREARPLSQFAPTVAPIAGASNLGGRFLTPGPKTVSGTVTVLGTGTGGLIVRAYAESTGELIGQATTASNGTYSIKCGANWQAVTVIAYDPTTYQAIAYDRVVPA